MIVSTISAGMNALAAVCITDFIRPAYLIIKKEPINEKVAIIVTRSLGTVQTRMNLESCF